MPRVGASSLLAVSPLLLAAALAGCGWSRAEGHGLAVALPPGHLANWKVDTIRAPNGAVLPVVWSRASGERGLFATMMLDTSHAGVPSTQDAEASQRHWEDLRNHEPPAKGCVLSARYAIREADRIGGQLEWECDHEWWAERYFTTSRGMVGMFASAKKPSFPVEWLATSGVSREAFRRNTAYYFDGLAIEGLAPLREVEESPLASPESLVTELVTRTDQAEGKAALR